MTTKRKVHRAHGSRKRAKPSAAFRPPSFAVPTMSELVAVSARPPAPSGSIQPIEVDGARPVTVITSSRVGNKVEQVTELLKGGEGTVLRLQAKGRAVGKLVTVVEIAKRALVRDGGMGCFQYTTASTVVVEKPKPEVKPEKQDSTDEDESDGFEFMPEASERARLAQPSQTAVPVLTIWLSLQSHSLLKHTYGEQSTKV